MPESALTFDHVSFAYPNGHGNAAPVLREISLRVERGERLGVIGPNGGGKSTLLKLAIGLLKPTSGRVETLGMRPDLARRSGRVGALPQKVSAELDFPITGRQAVELAASLTEPGWRRVSRDARRRAADALDLVGATEYADRHVGGLSGGQLQRTLIARAIARSAELLLLDEPTVGVDPEGQRRFGELLDTLRERAPNLSVVIDSHDIRAVAAGCDRVACLARTLHFHDAPGGLTPQVLAEVFSHGVEGIFGDLHLHAHSAGECPLPGDPHAHVHGPDCAHDRGDAREEGR
jgi:zinc transport system ATP-binding protein